MRVEGLIFAVVDTDAAAVESWNRWYDLEHLPPNIALAGIMSGRRYVATPELVASRLPSHPPAGFEEGRGLHLTIYLTSGDPTEAIATMTSRRDELEAAGRMQGAGNRVVRAGDAMALQWTAADPTLLLDDQDVPHIGHTALRIVLRRGGTPEALSRTALAAVGVDGVHGVASYQARFQQGIDCDMYFLEGDTVAVTDALRSAAPYPDETTVLLDAPFAVIVPFDYSFADLIANSSLPQTID